MHLTDDMYIVWQSAQADYMSKETDRDIQIVSTGLEHNRIARGAELVIALAGIDLVDLVLHLRLRHGWIKHGHVGAEADGTAIALGGNRESGTRCRCADAVDRHNGKRVNRVGRQA